jgi:hypothetical protein
MRLLRSEKVERYISFTKNLETRQDRTKCGIRLVHANAKPSSTSKVKEWLVAGSSMREKLKYQLIEKTL